MKLNSISIIYYYKHLNKAMENYKIIKNYLETFPNETTVETLINNIVKAEQTYEENVQKKIEKMKESIGNVYYYEDIDDNDRQKPQIVF